MQSLKIINDAQIIRGGIRRAPSRAWGLGRGLQHHAFYERKRSVEIQCSFNHFSSKTIELQCVFRLFSCNFDCSQVFLMSNPITKRRVFHEFLQFSMVFIEIQCVFPMFLMVFLQFSSSFDGISLVLTPFLCILTIGQELHEKSATKKASTSLSHEKKVWIST